MTYDHYITVGKISYKIEITQSKVGIDDRFDIINNGADSWYIFITRNNKGFWHIVSSHVIPDEVKDEADTLKKGFIYGWRACQRKIQSLIERDVL